MIGRRDPVGSQLDDSIVYSAHASKDPATPRVQGVVVDQDQLIDMQLKRVFEFLCKFLL